MQSYSLLGRQNQLDNYLQLVDILQHKTKVIPWHCALNISSAPTVVVGAGSQLGRLPSTLLCCQICYLCSVVEHRFDNCDNQLRVNLEFVA